MILDNIKKLISQMVNEKAFPVLAKVSAIDTSQYTCDCIELTPLGEELPTTYTRVMIPKLWGAGNSGIWMSPAKDAIVLLNFLNGDRNYPVISAVMGSDSSENCPKDTLIIKNKDVEIRIDDKVLIKNNIASLGEIIEELATKMAGLQTRGSAVTQFVDPAQKIAIETLKTQKINGLLRK